MLSLKTSICTTDDCKSFNFSDLTGEYSSGNLTGYGSPNPTLGNIVYAYLKVVNPSGTIYTIDLLANSSGLPTNNKLFEYTILNTDIGVTNIVTDGLWTFTYILCFDVGEGNQEVYSTINSILTTCEAECCVANLLASANLIDDCDCTGKSLSKYVKAWALLESLKAAARCGKVDDFNKLKDIINKICKNSGCKTCK